MTFQDREREIFFETVNQISDNSQNWVTRDEILRNVSTRITFHSAESIFLYFSMGNVKYLDDELNERFRISAAGQVYWQFLREESEKTELEKKSIQSVIDTNASVKATNSATTTLYTQTLPDTFRSQDRTANRSLILAAISVIFIIISAFLQYRDKTDQRIEELKLEVQKTGKTLTELQTSLEEVSFSIQKITTDTLLVKRKKK